MIKKILSALLITTLILSTSVIVFADNGISVTAIADMENGSVALSGYASSTVSITVVSDDVSFQDYATELEKCIFFGFVNPVDGKFEKSFIIPEASLAGKYMVYVSDTDSMASCSFMKTGTASQELLSDINSADSALSLKEISEANADVLGVDISDDSYEDASELAYAFLVALGAEYDSSISFYEDYIQGYALAKILKDETADGLKDNGLYLGIDYEEDYEKDSRLTQEAKAELFELILESEWEKLIENSRSISDAFSGEYASLRAISAVRTGETRTQLQQTMTDDFSDEFSFVEENTKYSQLRNPDKVYAELVGEMGNVKTISGIEELFDKAVSKVYNSENKSSSGGGGGGGGGGGSVYQETSSGVGISSSYGEKEKEDTADEKGFTFTDVKEGYWGYDAIYTLVENGIIKGYEDSTFRPEGEITRAEFTKIIVSYYESTGAIASNEGESFKDVSAHMWYYDPISKASALGIVTGSDSSFRPGEKISRQDAALILFRALKALGVSVQGEMEFADAEAISDYAKDAVSALAGSGYISGMGNASFAPLSNLTRAQAAQIIYNAIK